MSLTYITTDELSKNIKYDPRTIRESMKDSVLIEGIHYIRPFGGRKILYIWEHIERDMSLASDASPMSIPMASGNPVPADLLESHVKTRVSTKPMVPDTPSVATPMPNENVVHTSSPKPRVTSRPKGIPMANGGVCHG